MALFELIPILVTVGVAAASGLARQLIRAIFARPSKPTVMFNLSDGTCASVDLGRKDDLTPGAIAKMAATVETSSAPHVKVETSKNSGRSGE